MIHEIEFQTATKYEKLFKWQREKNEVTNILEAEMLTGIYLPSLSLDPESETRFRTDHPYQNDMDAAARCPARRLWGLPWGFKGGEKSGKVSPMAGQSSATSI